MTWCSCYLPPDSGPLTATPYKVYAVQASAAGIPLWWFLAISPVARLPGFLLATLLAAGAARLLRSRVIRDGVRALGRDMDRDLRLPVAIAAVVSNVSRCLVMTRLS
ncbi:MAG: hypothetical protein H7Y89_08755 [Steroidobacteraceae bacterium]|nr:hypothetical protein [Steroidobacteraceae bacterium]